MLSRRIDSLRAAERTAIVTLAFGAIIGRVAANGGEPDGLLPAPWAAGGARRGASVE